MTKRLSKNFTLQPVTFDLPDCASLAIVGMSGSGKSTLLKCLAGMTKPDAGAIHLGDHHVSQFSNSQAAVFRRTHCGFVFQQYSLIPGLSGLDNVTLPSALSGKTVDNDLLDQHRDTLGLSSEVLAQQVTDLSGGQQQRIAILRALVNGAEYLLCDEPTGALDTVTAEDTAALLFGSLSQGVSNVVVVTHDLGLAAQADTALVMHHGAVVEMINNPASAQLAEQFRTLQGTAS